MKQFPLIACAPGGATPGRIRASKSGIRRFGFTSQVLIDSENRILAGHGRIAAARQLGMAAAPCLRVDHMSAAEKRAYVLADNKLALNAGWDSRRPVHGRLGRSAPRINAGGKEGAILHGHSIPFV